MERILRKMLTVGLMLCGGTVMRPAAAPAKVGNVYRITVEMFDRFSGKQQVAHVDYLIRLNDGIQEAFRDAAKNGCVWALAPLLKRGAKKSAIDFDGYTALHWAAVSGREGVVRFLVEAGENKDAISRYGEAVLHLAVTSGDEGVVRFLVEAGVNKDVIGGYGRTSLHIAAAQGCEGIVRLLIEAKTGVGVVDKGNTTALEAGIDSDKYSGRISSMLINGYRAQLERRYPARAHEYCGGEEWVSLAHLGLPQEIIEHIMNWLPDGDFQRDLASLACVSRGCGILAYNIMSQRFSRIKAQKFDAFIDPSLQRARAINRQEAVQLLEQAKREGCAVALPVASPGE